MAVGNGTTTGNSPASNAIVLRTQVSAVVPIFTVTPATVAAVYELSPVNFTITATVGGSPATVTYTSGLPSGASYTFSSGAFSWTPALGQANTYTLVFSVVSTDLQTYTRNVGVTVNTLPLTAPTGLAASNIVYNAFDASWNPVAAATHGYGVSVWYGSGATNTPASDLEPFYNIAFSDTVAPPWGWTFSGIGSSDKYATTNYVELKFDEVGDTIVTKEYFKPVTSLSFNLKGYLTSSASNNIVAVYGTADGSNWTELQSYNTLNGDITTTMSTKTLLLDTLSGYRQFKFYYAMDERGNVGLGNIATVYDGAGTKFVEGWRNTAVAGTTISVAGARANRDYSVLVGSKNATETKSALLVLRTSAAAPTTTLVVR